MRDRSLVVSINQPAYLPWLGYFDRIGRSDVHVVLDHVQFEKNSVTNRNRIRTPEAWQWLTVPVSSAGKFGQLEINGVEVSGHDWSRKHWRSLQMNYARAMYFTEHAQFFEDLYVRPWTRLSDLLRATTEYLLRSLGLERPMVYSSELAAAGRKHELVLNICRELGATRYLSGPLGRQYLVESEFLDCGITIDYHDYRHPVYPQAFAGFVPNMSTIDLLFNAGPASGKVLVASVTKTLPTPEG